MEMNKKALKEGDKFFFWNELDHCDDMAFARAVWSGDRFGFVLEFHCEAVNMSEHFSSFKRMVTNLCVREGLVEMPEHKRKEWGVE